LLAVLGVAAAFNLGFAVVHLGRIDETRYGESLIYGHAARLLRGEALYQPIDAAPYTVVNYTPLYYGLAAALQALFGPGFLSGRLVSFVCALLLAGLVGRLAWSRTRAVWPALAAPLLFVSLGLVGPIPWSAGYKEDLLAVTLAVGSTVVLDGAQSRKGVVGAGLLAGATIMTKQSLVGPALAGTLWLVLCGRVRTAGWYLASAGLVAIGGALVMELCTHAFFANTIGGNTHQPFDALTVQYNLAQFVAFQSAAALLAAVAVFSSGLKRDLLALNWLGSLIPLVPIGAIGADYNYWLQFAALSAALATALVWQHRAGWSGALGAGLLGANAVFALFVVGSLVLAHAEFVQPAPGDRAAFAQLVQRVAEARGTVLTDPLDITVLAERPIVLEPILYSLREQDGSWDSRALVEQVCSGQVSLVILGYPLAEVSQRFPPTVGRALQQTFVLEERVPLAGRTRYVLVRDPSARCG
jgi:hypothetical protein